MLPQVSVFLQTGTDKNTVNKFLKPKRILNRCKFHAGSFSRSAVNYMAGSSSAVSNIVMSLVVLLTLLVITPLFHYTPHAILASIIISAVIGLIDFDAVILIWKIDKFDFFACAGAFFGVVFASVEVGLLIAVSESVYCLQTCSIKDSEIEVWYHFLVQ